MSFINSLNKIAIILTAKDKKKLICLVFVSFIITLIETIGIFSIVPFIAIASNPALISTGFYMKVYNILGFTSIPSFLILFGLILTGFFILRGIYSILHSYLLNSYVFGIFRSISLRLFQNYINMPYSDFANRNSADLTKSITSEAMYFSFILQYLLFFLSDIMILVCFYIVLLLVNIKATLILSVVLGVKVFALTKITSKIMKDEGVKRESFDKRLYKILTETFGNFKFIKMLPDKKNILKKMSDITEQITRTQTTYYTFMTIPKNILETIGFASLLLVIVFFIYKYGDSAFILPFISVYVMALYRMFPALSRILGSHNYLVFGSRGLDIVFKELTGKIEVENNEKIEFTKKIEIRNVNFSFEGREILKNINMIIEKGSKIAIIGESGSGKTTLVDIIIGIYKPEEGNIFIDDIAITNENIKDWRQKIGYIPQSIYLFDGTVAENVCFGLDYDEQKIIKALKKANIYDFLRQKEGLNTLVGENGIKLSGGQKQRIGIARALYRDPEILVLDEATSALDGEIENRIIEEVFNLSENITLVIIAHRKNTIKRCKIIYEFNNGILNLSTHQDV